MGTSYLSPETTAEGTCDESGCVYISVCVLIFFFMSMVEWVEKIYPLIVILISKIQIQNFLILV